MEGIIRKDIFCINIHSKFLNTKFKPPYAGGMEGLVRNQVEEDRIRQEWLESVGYKVIRFTNEQIFNNIDYALAIIKTTIDERYKREC